MSDTKLFEAIQKVKNQRKSGIGYPEIRKQLTEQNFSEDEIKAIIKKIDDDELRDVKRKGAQDKAFEHVIYAAFVMFFGCAVTAYTYINDMLEGGVYLIAFAPIVGGYLWFKGEWRKYLELKNK